MYFNHNDSGIYKGASPHTHTQKRPIYQQNDNGTNIVGAMKFVPHTHTHIYIYDMDSNYTQGPFGMCV